jgi:hypothetical protein
LFVRETFQLVQQSFLNQIYSKKFTFSFNFLAVQHERAPRNCGPLNFTNDLNGQQRPIQMPQPNFLFPLPIQIHKGGELSAFSATDSFRFMSPYHASGYFNHFHLGSAFLSPTQATQPLPTMEKIFADSLATRTAIPPVLPLSIDSELKD